MGTRTLNLLVVGYGSGSWTMRGRQLGKALGARVTSTPSDTDWRWADVVILVKRAARIWAACARAYHVPIVWDALDFWRQPQDNSCTESQALGLLASAIEDIQPHLTIGATQAMATAAHGFYVPHHPWPHLLPTPARRAIAMVAYEGNPAYLNLWHPVLRQACTSRGWQFVVNPPDLRQADLLVSLRGGEWDGWMPREWKSGVKLVNAILAGRPVITQASAAWHELRPEGTAIDSPADLHDALDAWTDYPARAGVATRACQRAPAFAVAAIAEQYHRRLQTLTAGREVTPC